MHLSTFIDHCHGGGTIFLMFTHTLIQFIKWQHWKPSGRTVHTIVSLHIYGGGKTYLARDMEKKKEDLITFKDSVGRPCQIASSLNDKVVCRTLLAIPARLEM